MFDHFEDLHYNEAIAVQEVLVLPPLSLPLALKQRQVPHSLFAVPVVEKQETPLPVILIDVAFLLQLLKQLYIVIRLLNKPLVNLVQNANFPKVVLSLAQNILHFLHHLGLAVQLLKTIKHAQFAIWLPLQLYYHQNDDVVIKSLCNFGLHQLDWLQLPVHLLGDQQVELRAGRHVPAQDGGKIALVLVMGFNQLRKTLAAFQFFLRPERLY